MSVQCPYCGEENHVDPADNEFYDENTLHQYQCGSCSKMFVFETEIEITFFPRKADCLNDAQHTWRPTRTYPIECTKMRCSECGELRNPSNSEF